MKNIFDFYAGKRVFLTGHTGFKGSWLCKILTMAGADVTGYALEPPTNPNMFTLSHAGEGIRSVIGDIRDFDRLKKAFDEAKPEIAIHLAAQPIVGEGFKSPRYTYEANVMGAVNILECVRQSDHVKSFLNVTTDKVYKSADGCLNETEPLGGFDPYAGSKSCSEIVTQSYGNSFFADRPTAISTARAGNAIGGGDFAKDRIIPDCVRAAERGEEITVRTPRSVRPYQHVLEPLFAYLMIAAKQYVDKSFEGGCNIGPDKSVETGQLVDLFCEKWGGISWKSLADNENPSETCFLSLDCSKIKNAFGWKPVWDIETAVDKTVEWTREYLGGGDAAAVTEKQINEYLSAASELRAIK